MDFISTLNSKINGFVWGLPMMMLLLGVGIFLSIHCGFPQFFHFPYIIKNTLGKAFEKKDKTKGSISPFKAMCTALAASIGTGNIAGVSGAIAIGGPGAVFWMWLSALFGMCTKFAEVTLAVKYRERNKNGDWVGGPMYYITNGLGRNFKWLAYIFSVFGALAAFGIGNMAQINTIAGTINTAIAGFVSTTRTQQTVITWVVATSCAVICAIVLIGGIHRLTDVCSLLVPSMAAIYISAALVVILVNNGAIPATLEIIVKGAFNPSSVAGGLSGVGIKTVITKGIGRGIFSNEAGLGSAPIAHAAADVDHPVQQGIYGIFEVFMDTIVICTMTAFVVLLGVGVHHIEYGKDMGATLAIRGFESVFGGRLPGVAIAVCLTLFSLSTILTWALYGTRCIEYLLGSKAAKLYQIVFCLFACVAGTLKFSLAWEIADTLNGLMAIPNLVAIALLSPVVIELAREYFGKL